MSQYTTRAAQTGFWIKWDCVELDLIVSQRINIDQEISGEKSTEDHVRVGIPQGSILRPVQFSLFISPLSCVIKPFGIRHHVYADDLKTLAVFYPDVDSRGRIEEATTAIKNWCVMNGLMLNVDKFTCCTLWLARVW